MSSVSTFANFLELHRSARLRKDPKALLNDASKLNYFWPELMLGQDLEKVVYGGTHIEEPVKLIDDGNFDRYNPGEIHTTGRNRTIRKLRVAYRFTRNSRPMTDAEILLNEGGDEFSRFKNMAFSIQQDLVTNHFNGIERYLWQRPIADDMEPFDNQSGFPYSIPALITENITTNPFRAPGWGVTQPTIEGVNPETHENHRNQRVTYDSADLDDPFDGIFAGFDKMLLRIDFKPPQGTKHAQYFENEQMQKLKIVTNANGHNIASALLRAANDFTRQGPQDFNYSNPMYKGFPILWAQELDNALLDEAAGAYTGSAYPVGKPRYFFINTQYLYLVFFNQRFQHITDKISGGATQPDVDTIFMVSWWNLFGLSRRHNGLLCPN